MPPARRVVCAGSMKNGSLPTMSAPAPVARNGREGGVDLAFGAGVRDMKLQPERARRLLHLLDFGRRSGIVRVDQTGDRGRLRHQLAQQSQPLRDQLRGQSGDAGDVAARPVEAGDEAELDRIAAGLEHDRNRRGRRLGREAGSGAAGGGDHGNRPADQFGGQRRQPIVLALRPAVFDRDVLALGIAGFAQAFAECRQIGRHAGGAPLSRNPITGIAGCCARAASGHAAAAPPRAA